MLEAPSLMDARSFASLKSSLSLNQGVAEAKVYSEEKALYLH